MQRDMYNEYTTLAKNTDAGDLAAVVANRNGQKKYSLMKGALDSSGNLTSSVSGQISQGRDIMVPIEMQRQQVRLIQPELQRVFLEWKTMQLRMEVLL